MVLVNWTLLKTTNKSLILVSISFLLLVLCTSTIFNVFAQSSSANGGTANGGTISLGTGMSITCTGPNSCYFTPAQANGGSANGGSINQSGQGEMSNNPSSPSGTSDIMSPIDGVSCDNWKYHFKRPFHIHVHLDIFTNGQNYTIPAQIGLIDKCFYRLHTHYEDGIIHIESPENTIYTLGMFLDIWHSQFNITWGIPSKVYVDGQEVNANNYRDIGLQDHDEIELVYGKPDVGPISYNGSF